jgi:hypothetical protein
MAPHLEETVVEVATSTFSPTNISPLSRPSRHAYVVPLADREKGRGNMAAQVLRSSYGYP